MAPHAKCCSRAFGKWVDEYQGAPIPGTFRKREAQAALEEILVEARRGAARAARSAPA